jgi:hypothetical protein
LTVVGQERTRFVSGAGEVGEEVVRVKRKVERRRGRVGNMVEMNMRTLQMFDLQFYRPSD